MQQAPAHAVVEPRTRLVQGRGAKPHAREGAKRTGGLVLENSGATRHAPAVGQRRRLRVEQRFKRPLLIYDIAERLVRRKLQGAALDGGQRRQQRARPQVRIAGACRMARDHRGRAREQAFGGPAREHQLALGRGMRQAVAALKLDRQEGIGPRTCRPYAVMQPHQPQMIEAQPGGLEHAQDLHRHLGRLRLEDALRGQTPERRQCRVLVHAADDGIETGKLGQQLAPGLDRLVFLARERARPGQPAA